MCSSNVDEDEAFDSSGPSLEIDSDDRDSALGDSESILTMSVTESVYNYKYENGRRYHSYSEGKYPVPNDETEKDRLDLQHHAFRLTLDGALYRAPIPKDLHNVLDVGTGTGIWAIEFAEEHPSAQVLGTDLSPIQPTEVPPNCSFLIDDCEKDWVYRDQFDLIHTRAMVAAVKDWNRFIEQAYANLKPGGYLELQEITFPAMATDEGLDPDNSPFLRWSSLFIEAASKIGIDALGPTKFAPLLRANGFVDIHAKNYKWPVGRWAKGDKMKLLGRFVMEDTLDWLPSSALALFTRIHKWTRDDVELFLASVRRELKQEKNRHFYANVIFWYARKPAEDVGFYETSEHDVVREEVQLESDEERPARSRDTGQAAEQVSSPGALADNASDLPIASSPSSELKAASVEAERQNLPLTSSKPLTSIDAFKNSVLSLAAEATAHMATAQPEPMSRPKSANMPGSESQPAGKSTIHDNLSKASTQDDTELTTTTATDDKPFSLAKSEGNFTVAQKPIPLGPASAAEPETL